jgi:hypothetical protein
MSCCVNGDYAVGSLTKNTSCIYFKLLQLIISCINICGFTDNSPGYPDVNIHFYVVMLIFRSPDDGR